MSDKFLGLSYMWWLVISMPFYAAGEYFSKLFANTHAWYYVVVGVLCYAVGSALWFPALMLRNELLVVDTIWKSLAAMMTVILALAVFHEKLSWVQYVGVVFVIIGVLMVK